ncbi:Swarming motility protein YbiA [Tetrabaena socialis]|uniref:Swarming motility protein YbiA n=1 Tax=Tetrabaena socialis TaxID=47790 RepID=A0A2J8A429_9CHLO|nr:Swarming motility protein YbiA [Tetrabaena socialis]|eukprot:PNH07280.1 Swarming motility protein YbiA [Tetrabaena socialis]
MPFAPLPLCVEAEGVGPDLLMTGYMPSSGGLWALEATLEAADEETAAEAAADSAVHLPSAPAAASPPQQPKPATPGVGGGSGSGAAAAAAAAAAAKSSSIAAKRRRGPGGPQGRAVSFYKAWDQWGALSNFSPHPISMPVEQPSAPHGGATAAAAAAAVTPGGSSRSNGSGGVPSAPASAAAVPSALGSAVPSPAVRQWCSVEHYYQAHKFSGGHHPDAAAVVEAIAAAPSPEEAARIGRRTERTRPELLRPDWATRKVDVMLAALRAKFSTHPGPRSMLLATAGVAPPQHADAAGGGGGGGAGGMGVGASASNGVAAAAAAVAAGGGGGSGGGGGGGEVSCFELVEASPHDYFWGVGYERTGQNKLGRLLMQVRDELLSDSSASECAVGMGWMVPDQLPATAEASAAAPASRGPDPTHRGGGGRSAKLRAPQGVMAGGGGRQDWGCDKGC